MNSVLVTDEPIEIKYLSHGRTFFWPQNIELDPADVQAAKPDRFLSAETKAKLLALHIINATSPTGRLS